MFVPRAFSVLVALSACASPLVSCAEPAAEANASPVVNTASSQSETPAVKPMALKPATVIAIPPADQAAAREALAKAGIEVGNNPGAKADAGGSASGTVTWGTLIIMGSLKPEHVAPELNRLNEVVTRCYRNALKTSAGLSGKMEAKFIINGKGAVVNVRVDDDTLGSKPTKDCLSRALKLDAQFPRPKGGGIVIVRAPYTFATGQ